MQNNRYELSYYDVHKGTRIVMSFVTRRAAKTYAELLTAADKPKLVDTASNKDVDFVLHGRYRVSYYDTDYNYIRKCFDTIDEAKQFAMNKIQASIFDIVNDKFIR